MNTNLIFEELSISDDVIENRECMNMKFRNLLFIR